MKDDTEVAKVCSTIEIHHGGQMLEVSCLKDDTIRMVLNRVEIPIEGAVLKNGDPVKASTAVVAGDKIEVAPEAGKQG